MVLSYNEKTGVNEYKKVRRLFVHKDVSDELYELTINNEVLKVTASHKFYVKTNGGYDWIAVKDMKIGEKKIDENGNLNTITDIKYNSYYGTLYNLSVEDNHNYYVTIHNYLVHNVK